MKQLVSSKGISNGLQKHPSTSSRTALSLLFYALLLISCSPETTKEKPFTDQGYSQRYTAASFTVEQHISKKEITVAEQLELILDAAAPENVEVEFPAYSAALGDFTLRDVRGLPARMTGSGDDLRIVRRVIYILDPYLSGTYTIPAMPVTFHDPTNDAQAVELMTGEIEIQVKSLLPPDSEQVGIKDIQPPHSLPPDRVRQALLAGLVFILAVLMIYGFYFWEKKRSKKVAPEIQPGPEEIARQEMDRLLAENLLAKGEIKLFHLRISDILRHYIENRFGLKAPERTTEEFLLELSQAESTANVLLSIHKNLLADFLSQCDLVKFAKHEPSPMESQKTVDICREFIEKTREQGSRGQGF